MPFHNIAPTISQHSRALRTRCTTSLREFSLQEPVIEELVFRRASNKREKSLKLLSNISNIWQNET
jgi:hypothetical protein